MDPSFFLKKFWNSEKAIYIMSTICYNVPVSETNKN